MSELQECNACGKCCKKYGGEGGLGSINQEEYDRLPEFAKKFAGQLNPMEIYDIWIFEGMEMVRCPFLIELEGEKSVCMIYDHRPDVCKSWPDKVNTDGMVAVKCEMMPEFRSNDDHPLGGGDA